MNPGTNFQPAVAEAEIRVLPPGAARVLRVSFILKTFTLSKQNEFAELNVPGLDGAPLQLLRVHPRTLVTVLYFDGRATHTDVREPMKQVMDLMSHDRSTHAPPVLSFEWAGFTFRCVLESSTEKSFRSLFPDGRPSRGLMHVAFKEYLTVQELLRETTRD